METSKKDSSPGSNDNFDLNRDAKRPNVWGPFYLILGIGGLFFSSYSIFCDLGNIVPLYGTVMAGILIGAISVLILIYGIRVMRRDI